MDRSRHVIGLAAVALLGASVVGLITRDDPSPAGSSGPGEVQIAGFAYGPDPVTVAVGSTITWTNSDDTAHTVDSDSGGELDSGSIDGDATFEHTFDTPGTFTYFCAFHPFMRGTVEVTG